MKLGARLKDRCDLGGKSVCGDENPGIVISIFQHGKS